MKLGTNTIASLKIGSTDISEVRIGSVLVWSAFTYDADALAYINANTAITLDADKLAINSFFVGLKSDGIYTKIKAMYLPKWGAAANDKWNLVNPVDSNAAFRLSFTGGWTHSTSGIVGNAVNTIAETYLYEHINLTLNNAHISIYIRSNISNLAADIGALAGANQSNIFPLFAADGNFYGRIHDSSSGTANTDSRGLFMANRVNGTQVFNYKNTTKYTIAAASTARVTNSFVLGRLSQTVGNYSNRQFSFVSIGDGLSDAEQINFYNRVQTLMTYFGINV